MGQTTRQVLAHPKSSHEDDRSELEVSDSVETFKASVGLTQMDKWLTDSGTSSHMTWKRNVLTNYQEFRKAQNIGLGDDSAVGMGDVHVNLKFKMSQSKLCVIYHVLYVPELTCNKGV